MYSFMSATGITSSLLFAFAAASLFLVVGMLILLFGRVPRRHTITETVALGLSALIIIDSVSSSFAKQPHRALIALPLVLIVIWAIKTAATKHKCSSGKFTLEKGLPSFGVSDLVGVAAGTLFIAPLSRNGSGYFTQSTNDWPNYVYSVLARSHPDIFVSSLSTNLSSYQLFRAEGEKPGATTALYYVSDFFGRNPAFSLSSLLFLTTILTAANIFRVVKAYADCGSTVSAVAALFGLLNPIVVSRLLDAQAGHALSFCFITCIAAEIFTSGQRPKIFTLSVHFSALVLVGPTLALATTPVLIACLLLQSRLTRHALLGSLFALVGPVLAIGEFRGLIRSIKAQTVNEDGFEFPFPTPTELLGLHPLRMDGSVSWWLISSWASALIITLILLTSGRNFRGVSQVTARVLSMMLIAGPLSYFIFTRGINSYQTHKFFTVVVIVFLPLGIGILLSQVQPNRRTFIALISTVPLVSLFIAAGVSTPLRVGNEEFELAEEISDKDLGDGRIINIATGNLYVDSYFPLLLTDQRTRSVTRTYASATFPVSGLAITTPGSNDAFTKFLTLGESADSGISISELDLSWSVGDSLPARLRHITGKWYPFDGMLWTDERRFFVSIENQQNGPSSLTATAVLVVPPRTTSNVRIKDCHGDLLQEHSFANHADSVEIMTKSITIEFHGAQREKCLNHDVLLLETPRPVSPFEFGLADRRKLSFGISEIVYHASP